MKANIFQKRSAGFKMKDLNKKKVHQGDFSIYVKNVNLGSLKHQYKYMEYEGKNKTDGRKLLLDVLKLIGIS
ncbi:hypothetical protein B7P43_G14309 [Cryptotermes secundus]|uniref:Uncharacterized protein n=1 Tax=Cryptotermes secundus TaxID=105785 RepID=A0A2J7PTY8_9NEOP|nr:hypothetical protein B7P43_G14309 [Cryptotermes secundus]